MLLDGLHRPSFHFCVVFLQVALGQFLALQDTPGKKRNAAFCCVQGQRGDVIAAAVPMVFQYRRLDRGMSKLKISFQVWPFALASRTMLELVACKKHSELSASLLLLQVVTVPNCKYPGFNYDRKHEKILLKFANWQTNVGYADAKRHIETSLCVLLVSDLYVEASKRLFRGGPLWRTLKVCSEVLGQSSNCLCIVCLYSNSELVVFINILSE